MKSKPRVDSFGTFLDHTISGSDNTIGGSVYIGRPRSGLDLEKYKYGDEASHVLSIVATLDTLNLADLLEKSRMPLREFTEAVEILRNEHLVSVSGSPGREVVAVTPEGKRLAAPARSKESENSG